MYHKVRERTTIANQPAWEAFLGRHLRPNATVLDIGDVDLATCNAPARTFDAAIASMCLHRIGDLGGALDKIALLLNSNGVVIVQEYGELHAAKAMLAALAARFDEREFSWQPYPAQHAIEAGQIAEVGFLYCGALEDV